MQIYQKSLVHHLDNASSLTTFKEGVAQMNKFINNATIIFISEKTIQNVRIIVATTSIHSIHNTLAALH